MVLIFFWLILIVCALISLIVRVIFVGMYERNYIDKNMIFYKTGKFAAVIIMKKNPMDYLQGIGWLLKSFKQAGAQYKVFLCNSPEEFKQIVSEVDANELYILGHGKRSQVYFKEGAHFDYKNLAKCPKKKFVGQYHCNHGGGKSLADYLEAQESDVTMHKRCNIEIYIIFLFKYIRSKKPKSSIC